MKDNIISDILEDIKEIFIIAWKYFGIALVIALYVSYKTDSLTGLMIGSILSSFSAIIGIEKYNCLMIERISENRMKINDYHFNQLIIDTEALVIVQKELKTQFPNEVRVAKALLFINKMIDHNNDTINMIKSIKNGKRHE